LYEDYRDALPLYLELHTNFPNNANVAYRIGLCYLNIPNEKHKAVPFLEAAVKGLTDNYMEGYYTENKAPREALLHYGKALRITAEFDKAKEAFKAYSSKLSESDSEQKIYVASEMAAIDFAKQLMSNPMDVKFTSAGRAINTRFPEINPVASADTSVMVYTSIQQFYNAIMHSNRGARAWSYPFNLNNQIFADGEIRTVGISADGKTLLLSRNDNDVYNIYSSQFDVTKNVWGVISRLPKEINSRNWETYASFSPTSDTIYFSSNRPGGRGGFDIYMSIRTLTGWSEAISIGNTINTSFDEIAPAISHDGKKMFFSSKGHQTMGGFDIFVSQKINGRWTKPINLRYPINTADDDVFFHPIGDGSSGFVSRLLPQSFGENDIYLIKFNLESLFNSTPYLDIKPQSSFTLERTEQEGSVKKNSLLLTIPQ
jgi:hypothetical protein